MRAKILHSSRPLEQPADHSHPIPVETTPLDFRAWIKRPGAGRRRRGSSFAHRSPHHAGNGATNRDQVAGRLGDLIQARFPEDTTPDVLDMYDTLYRSHSTMDVHPPLTMNQLAGDGDRVEVDCQPWLEPHKALRVGAAFLLVLSRWIDETLYGTPTSRWDGLLEPFRPKQSS